MVIKITLKKLKILCLLTLFMCLFQFSETNAQTRIYASSISSQNETDNASNAIDQNTGTRARVRASSGIALGIGQYSGHLELQFATTLPANTTSYVKIATEDNLLPFLLGGSLGGLLSDVAGGLLIGNQEFTVQAKNGSTVVLDGDSQIPSDFAGERLRIITDAEGDFYLMITPDQAYNRIRFISRVGSLIGLGNTKRLDVYDAFYVTDPANCGSPSYTSFSGSGISLDLLELGEAGVENPERAIDADPNNFSTLSLGVLGVGSSIEQTVYFEGLSQPSDQFAVRIRLAQTLLDLNVANNIRVISSNGGTVVQDVSLSTLLSLNLLNLSGNQITTIPVAPGAPVDRITLRFFSLVGASVTQNIEFFGVTRTPASPEITDPSTVDATVCEGGTIDLIADTDAGNELRWYDVPTGGMPLATVNSGETFTTPALTADTTYYVAAATAGCPEESARVAVEVTVSIVDTPTTTEAAQEFCAFDAPTVADLQVNESDVVFYAADTGGTPLDITTPLEDATVYYASLTDAATGCESAERLAITVTLNNLCGVTLNLKVMLQGPLFGAADGLMRDNLRQQGAIPLSQPYSTALSPRFAHVNGGGTETTTQAVLDANAGTGDAVVDWIFVEIRDAANQETVIRTVSALLQRDGDIMAANGGPLNVDGLPASFFVSLKHRNHFGALSTEVLNVVNAEVALDFTTIENDDLFALSGFTPDVAMATMNGMRALYTGNANLDGQVKYDGVANDRQVAAGQVLSHPDNTAQLLNFSNAEGYYSGDVNMDGKVLYDGANNDRQFILNIIITYPLNENTLSNYNGMFEQIPQ